MKVTVEHEFWQVFPEAQISVLVVKGLDNRVDESKDPYFKSLLDKGCLLYTSSYYFGRWHCDFRWSASYFRR